MSMNVGNRPAGGDVPPQGGDALPPGAQQTQGQQGQVPGQQQTPQQPGQPGQVPGQPGQPQGTQNQQGAKGTQNTQGLRSSGTSGTSETKETKKPTVTYDADTVGEKKTQSTDSDPLGEPPVPMDGASLNAQQKSEQADATAALVGTLQDLLKSGLNGEMVADVLNRANHLQENPSESFLVQMFGPDFGKTLAAQLDLVSLSAADEKFVTDHFGAFAAELLGDYKANVAEFFQNSLGEGPLGGLSPEQFNYGLNLLTTIIKDVTEGVQAGEGFGAGMRLTNHDASPPEDIPGDGSFGVDDKGRFPVAKGVNTPKEGTAPPSQGEFAKMIAMVTEGGFDAIMTKCMALQSKDQQENLKKLKADLSAMVAQQDGLRKQILLKTNEIAGKEAAAAEQTGKAEKAAECAKTWGIIQAIVFVVVAIVVAILAVLAAIWSGGSSLLLIAAVAACISAAITVIQAIPKLMQAIAMLLKACGMSDAAKALDDAAADVQKFMDQDWFKWTCFAIQICCVLVSLGCGIGSAVGAAGSGASVGTQGAATAAETATKAADVATKAAAAATDAAAKFGANSVQAIQAADAATKAAQAAKLAADAAKAAQMAETIRTVSTVTQVAAGCAQIGISIGMYQAQKDLIGAMKQLAELQAQLAKLDVQIKFVVAQIDDLEKKQGQEQDRIKRSEEQNQAIQANFGKAVEARAAGWDAILNLGR